MKRKILIAGLLCLALLAAGCGNGSAAADGSLTESDVTTVKTDDGSYTVYVLDHDDSLAAGKWETHEAVDIAVRVAGLERIERVEFTGVDVPEQKIELPFSVENGELHVRIPRFAIAGMLRLIPKGGMSIGR